MSVQKKIARVQKSVASVKKVLAARKVSLKAAKKVVKLRTQVCVGCGDSSAKKQRVFES